MRSILHSLIILQIICGYSLVDALRCVYSTDNKWDLFQLKYRRVENNTKLPGVQKVHYEMEISDPDPDLQFVFGTKYCLDAASQFLPFAFSFDDINYEFEFHGLNQNLRPVNVTLSSNKKRG